MLFDTAYKLDQKSPATPEEAEASRQLVIDVFSVAVMMEAMPAERRRRLVSLLAGLTGTDLTPNRRGYMEEFP